MMKKTRKFANGAAGAALLCCWLVVVGGAAWPAIPQEQASQKASSTGNGKSAERDSTAPADKPESAVPPKVYSQHLEREGITVDFVVEPTGAGARSDDPPDPLIEEREAVIRFKIADTSGAPLSSLFPVAWIDPRTTPDRPNQDQCRMKAQAFFQGSLRTRPAVDLNAYFVMSLNDDGTIVVIDPQIGFNDSKLFTLISLKGPGADWVVDNDRKRLYVSVPSVNEVAIVDTQRWRTIAYVAAGPSPGRVVLQPDRKYLWVANDQPGAEVSGGVTVIDTLEMKKIAEIPAGRGRHEIAITADDRFAFVTNPDDGTVTVIDIRELAVVKTLATGKRPVALAYTPLAGVVYVADESDGTVAVVDVARQEIIRRIQLDPGLNFVRFEPNGRLAFVTNGPRNLVYILDASAHQVRFRLAVGRWPDQVAFTDAFAYIRLRDADQVQIIELADLAGSKVPHIVDFPAGQNPPSRAGDLGIADTIVAAPEGNAAMIANPADRRIYYYHEGMAAPNVSFSNYSRRVRGILVAEQNLRETEPGVYSTSFRLTGAGVYDVVFYLDSPRVLHCFDLPVAVDPHIKKERVAIQLEPLLDKARLPVDEDFHFQVRVRDSLTAEPRDGLPDLGLMIYTSSGWRKRVYARPAGNGLYEFTVRVPQPGVYYLFFEVPSLGLRLGKLPHAVLQASTEAAQIKPPVAPGPP
jgi:YVTN family beta-propeller protein